MNYKKIALSEAKKFHGHLGPYLMLGILAGEIAIEKLQCKKYFGIYVKVWGANKKPKSCLIDGLQLSTGATYGKGNIQKLNGSGVKIEFYNCLNTVRNNKAQRKKSKISNEIIHKRITLKFKDDLIQILKETKTHRDSEVLARKLYKTDYNKLFKFITHNS